MLTSVPAALGFFFRNKNNKSLNIYRTCCLTNTVVHPGNAHTAQHLTPIHPSLPSLPQFIIAINTQIKGGSKTQWIPCRTIRKSFSLQQEELNPGSQILKASEINDLIPSAQRQQRTRSNSTENTLTSCSGFPSNFLCWGKIPVTLHCLIELRCFISITQKFLLTIYLLLEEKNNKQISCSTEKVTQLSLAPWGLQLDHSLSKLGKALRVTSTENNLL